MRKVWFTSDEHYGHEKILQYENRPFKDTREMEHTLVQNHNEVVSSGDIVYHLGDFMFARSWKDVERVVRKLNGTHVLIGGNHDWVRPFEYVEAGFLAYHTSLWLDGYLLIHDPAVAGVMKHVKTIHGHLHGLTKFAGPNTYSVCVEVNDYYPVAFDAIKEHFNES